MRNVEHSKVAALFVLLAGCDEPLKPLELIEDLRVLGARVEVEGAPERAAPRPGERVNVRWLVAAPEPAPIIGWSLEACWAAPSEAGIPSCAGPAFASAAAPQPMIGEPSIGFDVPAEPLAPRLLVRGAVCPDGPAGAASGGAPCAGSALGTRVVSSFALAADGDENQNPALEEDALALDGMSLPAADLIADGACERVPNVPAGSGPHELSLRIDEADRDALVAETALDPTRESLQLGHFATAGELARALSAVPAREAAEPVRVTWNAPSSAPPEGLLARFFFVVRDLRGGSDWLERGVCVVP